MKRILATLVLLAVASAGFAAEQWLGIYLQGAKIGYMSSVEVEGGWNGTPGRHTDSLSVIDSMLLGTRLLMRIKGTSYFDEEGGPQRMLYEIESGGRVSVVAVLFKGDEAHVTSTMAGKTLTKVLKMPEGRRFVSDPTVDLLSEGAPKGEIEFVTFDPNLLALIEGKATYVGREKTLVGDLLVEAHVIQIDDPRASMKVYISQKGDMIKVTGPIGIEMFPEPKEMAMDLSSEPGAGPDIAFATAIKPDRPIKNAGRATLLRLKVSGPDLSGLPSDGHQTVKKDGDHWIVSVHPVLPDPKKSLMIAQAAERMPMWTRSATRIQSDSGQFKSLAKKIVGDRTNVVEAAEEVRLYVNSIIRANAGIGMIRDAREILETKEGVCRDHAVLSATIMRAAGIPARLASGLVYAQGRFFYHAWVEAYDGNRWVGFDSTRRAPRLSATHIKTGQGTIEQAYSSFLLEGVRFEVLEVRS